jgi:hypothetical protein
VGYDARQTRVFVVRQGPPRTAKAHKPAHLRTTPAHNHCQPLISDLMVRIRVCHLYKNSTSPLPTLDPASPLPPPAQPSSRRRPFSLPHPPPACRSFSLPHASPLLVPQPRRPNGAAASATGRPRRAAAVSIRPSPPLRPGLGGQIRRMAVGSGVWRPDPWPGPAPHLLRCLFLTVGGGGLSSWLWEVAARAPRRGRRSFWPREAAARARRPSSRPRDAKLLAAGGSDPSSRPR